jgi:hypothetical protein
VNSRSKTAPPERNVVREVAGRTLRRAIRRSFAGLTHRTKTRTDRLAHHLDRGPLMFAFFSNRLGCLGSIVVSIIGTLFLLALMNLLFR